MNDSNPTIQEYLAAQDYVGYDTRIDWPTPELAALIGLLPAGRALDIGCGHGTESIFLGSFGWKVTGFDQAFNSQKERPIQTARARLKLASQAARANVRFREVAIQDFKLATSGKYDLVIDRLVYNSWLDRGIVNLPRSQRLRHAILMLAAQALRPGGLFVLRFRDPSVSRWGVIEKNFIPPNDRKFLSTHFTPANGGKAIVPIGFSALVSPCSEPDRTLTTERKTLSLVILRRK